MIALSASAAGQETVVPPVAEAAVVESCHCVTIPALTPVVIELMAPVGSKISTTGEHFPIVLHEPIIIDGREVIAAGAVGEGEIIHAKKAGGSGSAGELVLAARFLKIGENNLRLRSMKVAVVGRDAIHTIDTVNAASVLSPVPVSLIGFFITGRNVEIPAGTLAAAKTAEVLTIPLKSPVPPAVPYSQ